jgi:hypothetical protein
MESALRRIETDVSNVPKVNWAQKRVGPAHALQGPHRGNPQGASQTDPPPRRETEREATGDHDHDEHQFAIAAEQEIWAIGRLMDHGFSGFVDRVHV